MRLPHGFYLTDELSTGSVVLASENGIWGPDDVVCAYGDCKANGRKMVEWLVSISLKRRREGFSRDEIDLLMRYTERLRFIVKLA